MRNLFFALMLASGVFAQNPSFWQNRQLMPSPFGKPAPSAAKKPLAPNPELIQKAKRFTLRAKPGKPCTPPMPAMQRPEKFTRVMPVTPADPAVDPDIVSKVSVCEP